MFYNEYIAIYKVLRCWNARIQVYKRDIKRHNSPMYAVATLLSAPFAWWESRSDKANEKWIITHTLYETKLNMLNRHAFACLDKKKACKCKFKCPDFRILTRIKHHLNYMFFFQKFTVYKSHNQPTRVLISHHIRPM